MKILRYLLFPVVPIYFMVTWLRNTLYDWGVKKSVSYNFPVICVGNLSVGGTGKTPMVEYLVKLLKEDKQIATLSRGYKRKSKGFQVADKYTTVETIGDEPFQFFNKFKDSIAVAVDADRQNGIEKLRALNNRPEVIILDDAFQHRKVKPGFNILLTTFANPYFKDIVLPTGNLREPRRGAKRADVIMVTKCPEHLNSTKKAAIIDRISPLSHQQVFFSSIVYSEILLAENKSLDVNTLNNFALVTGIANASHLVKFLKKKGLKFEHFNFKDHHNFEPQEIKTFVNNDVIVTTEKDFMRLKQFDALKEKLYYLPIQATIENEKEFNALIKRFVKR
ncbi:tetraacyldisaccharide 4'-kinase [Flavobacteriaceae bacterium GSB9]|nr:tetraacyldisaccharide 4'-kinase [Flavobacteriaceae bacterium GSB9]